MFSFRAACGCIAANILVVLLLPASADDIVPPPWTRGDPFSTLQEWEFLGPGDTPPDGTLLFNPNGVPFAVPFPGLVFFPDGGAGPFGLGGYLGTADVETSNLLFEIPNIPDDRPVKHLQIQINGVWGPGAAPTVISMTGFFGPTFPPGVFVGSAETFPGFHRVEWWDIFPNPDFESFLLHLPADSFVNQVVIDTISAVPLPPALPLLLAACTALGLRRRHSGARRPV